MDLSAPGYETATLRFEPLSESHKAILRDSEIEEAVWKYMPALSGGSTLRKYLSVLMQAQSRGKAAYYVLFQKSDEAFVGICGFCEINKIHRRLRNHIVWHPPHMDTTRLYRASQFGMIERAYLWRAKRMEWQINPRNTFILQNLQSLNPTREAYLRNFERTVEGVWIDKIVFSMTRPEMAEAMHHLKASAAA